MKKTSVDRRQRDLAKIHIAKKQLGLDEATYRAMLLMVAGVQSASELDAQGRNKVLAHLFNAGFKAMGTTNQRPFKKPNLAISSDKEALLRKIEAYLAEAKRPWDYAHGIARRMFKVNRLQWCHASQLHKIVAALEYDARRHGRSTL